MNNLKQIFQVYSRKLNCKENTSFMQFVHMIPGYFVSVLNLQPLPVNLCGLVMDALLSINI